MIIRLGGRTPNGEVQPGRRNFIDNGDFSTWQQATTFTSVGAFNGNNTHDMFWTLLPAAGYTVSRQVAPTTMPPGLSNAARYQRVAGNANTTAVAFGYDFLTPDGRKLKGRQCVLSVYVRAGNNWSGGTSLTMVMAYGTGTDQSRRLVVMTGEVLKVQPFGPAPTSVWQRYQIPWYFDATCNEATFYATWSHSGVAGADDWVEFTGFQLEEGLHPTPFEYVPETDTLLRCQRRYYKTFPQSVAPATALASMVGCYRFLSYVAGAVTLRGPAHPFPTPMRAVPTIVTYNPFNANVNAFDDASVSDCPIIASTISDNSVRLVCTANAACAAGASPGIQFTADARV